MMIGKLLKQCSSAGELTPRIDDLMRDQIADYKAALDLQAKWFCEWQAKVRRVRETEKTNAR